MKDTFTLEEIKKAITDHYHENARLPDCGDIEQYLTRSKHNFAVGQVMYCQNLGSYQKYELDDDWCDQCRPISLTEAGPPYQKLVDAYARTITCPKTDEPCVLCVERQRKLDQFYQEIGDE